MRAAGPTTTHKVSEQQKLLGCKSHVESHPADLQREPSGSVFYDAKAKTFVTLRLKKRSSIFCMTSARLHNLRCVCVCVHACMHVYVGLRACQPFIVNKCVMVFTALRQRLTVHLLRSGGRWHCQEEEEGSTDGKAGEGGREGRREGGREIKEEKEWPSGAPLHQEWSLLLVGGKINQKVWDPEKEKEGDKGLSLSNLFPTGAYP